MDGTYENTQTRAEVVAEMAEHSRSKLQLPTNMTCST